MLDLHLNALRQASCDDLYTSTVSSVQTHKSKKEKLLGSARPGDTVVIWRLNRLGRSTKHLIEVVQGLEPPRAAPESLQDPIDTT